MQDIPAVVIQQLLDGALALAVGEGEIDDKLLCQIGASLPVVPSDGLSAEGPLF